MEWEDLGMGLSGLWRPGNDPVDLTTADLAVLDVLCLPVLLFDPATKQVVRRNKAMADKGGDLCAALSRPPLFRALETACTEGRSLDLHVPLQHLPPDMFTAPHTFHCHSVRTGDRRLVTLQFTAMLGPPLENDQTATDGVLRLLDGMLDCMANRDPDTVQIRQRVADDRMQDPMWFAGPDVSWQTRRSLEVMLGIRADGPACPWIRR